MFKTLKNAWKTPELQKTIMAEFQPSNCHLFVPKTDELLPLAAESKLLKTEKQENQKVISKLK